MSTDTQYEEIIKGLSEKELVAFDYLCKNLDYASTIGSVIIGNNDFSNIEKIAISTSTTVVGQNVGEYLGGKSDAFDNIDKDLGNTLQGAVLSFAISSFFAKNDTLADILGMDGTFVGGLADFTVSYTLGYYGSQAISDLFAFSVNNISYSNNKIFKNLA